MGALFVARGAGACLFGCCFGVFRECVECRAGPVLKSFHTYSDVFTLHRKSDRDNNNPHDDVLAPRSTKQRNLVELYLPNVLTHPGILHAFSFWLLVLHAFPHEKP